MIETRALRGVIPVVQTPLNAKRRDRYGGPGSTDQIPLGAARWRFLGAVHGSEDMNLT
jgi:hypothetical protein